VCEGLVEAGPYEAAWIGTVDAAGESISESSATGDHPALPDDSVPVDTDHPAAVASRAGTIQGIDALPAENGDGGADSSRQIAVPLRHGDSEYGVITLVAPTGLRVDEREATVLTALGRAIASALSAVETRRILVADDVVDVELSVRDDDLFFVRITDEVACQLTYEGAVADADVPSLYFTATGAPADAVLEAAADCPDVVAVSTVIGDGEKHLLEFELGRDPSSAGSPPSGRRRDPSLPRAGGIGRVHPPGRRPALARRAGPRGVSRHGAPFDGEPRTAARDQTGVLHARRDGADRPTARRPSDGLRRWLLRPAPAGDR